MSHLHACACFCGAVEIDVGGAPEVMGHCHGASCRAWLAGPVSAFTPWKPEHVKVGKGVEFIGRFRKAENSDRQFRTQCGGHLMPHHPKFGLTGVYAVVLPTLAFAPRVHVNYADSTLPMKDGLPKLKDFPAELGGPDHMMVE